MDGDRLAGAGTAHYLLVKLGDDECGGTRLDARQAAAALLRTAFWPLWRHTKCRRQVKAGDRVAIYLAGARHQCVIARADVREVAAWTPAHAARYPLVLSGLPDRVLVLDPPTWLDPPRSIHDCLHQLSFYRPGAKWGVALMGGMRTLTARDYELLTGCGPASSPGAPG